MAEEYQITEIRYTIQGITRQWALENIVPLQEGQRFASEDELLAAINETKRILHNQRELQSFSVNWKTKERPEPSTAVQIDISVTDTWNIFILPRVRYDSNDALSTGLWIRNYNFLGTLSILQITPFLDFPNEASGEDTSPVAGLFTTFELPFRWLEYQWIWEIYGTIEYQSGEGLVGRDLETSVGIELPFLDNDWLLAYTQGISTTLPSSEVSFGTEIDTGLRLPYTGALYFAPETSVKVRYALTGPTEPEDLGPLFRLTGGLLSNQIDWIGNLRNGLDLSLDSTINLNSYGPDLYPSFYASGSGYLAFFQTEEFQSLLYDRANLLLFPFGISARLGLFYNVPSGPNDSNVVDDGGFFIRGIYDNAMSGNLGIFVNGDIVLGIVTIPNFVEGQLSIFMDTALITDTQETFQRARDLRYSVGVETLVFLLQARSIYIRLSVGVDPERIRDEGRASPEIFFGTGHYY